MNLTEFEQGEYVTRTKASDKIVITKNEDLGMDVKETVKSTEFVGMCIKVKGFANGCV